MENFIYHLFLINSEMLLYKIYFKANTILKYFLKSHVINIKK